MELSEIQSSGSSFFTKTTVARMVNAQAMRTVDLKRILAVYFYLWQTV
jgi:hypothetical protein